MIQHVCDSISFELIKYLTFILEDIIMKFEQYTLIKIITNNIIMFLFAVKEINQWIKASATSSLDLCPDFMGSVMGQGTFPFHFLQKPQPIILLVFNNQ